MKRLWWFAGITAAMVLCPHCNKSPTSPHPSGAPFAPALASPANGSTNQTTAPTLGWNASTGAESYGVQVSTAASFTTVILSQAGVTATQSVVTGLASGTTYYWRVNATDTAGNSSWSGAWHFTTMAVSALFPTMVSIPAGTFQMGDTNSQLLNYGSGSTPVHSVTLGAFTMSQTLVTQAQYVAVMGVNPSYFDSGSTWPVEDVNWYDAAWFCNKLSKLAGLDTVYTYSGIYQGSGYDTLTSVAIDYTKNGYRLPTEAEWEYACRAGTTADYYWGQSYPPLTTADTAEISAHAWWWYNSPNGTQPVATKPANGFGLYDMSGNVWEWCNDWYGSYSATSQTNPTGATSGGYRVLRGGSWDYNGAGDLCAAYRVSFPDDRYYGGGVRVVCGVR